MKTNTANELIELIRVKRFTELRQIIDRAIESSNSNMLFGLSDEIRKQLRDLEDREGEIKRSVSNDNPRNFPFNQH